MGAFLRDKKLNKLPRVNKFPFPAYEKALNIS